MGSTTTDAIIFRPTFEAASCIQNNLNKALYQYTIQYPAGDAHGLNLGRLAAQLIQLVFTKQQFLRYLIIICCWKTQKQNITQIKIKYSYVVAFGFSKSTAVAV